MEKKMVTNRMKRVFSLIILLLFLYEGNLHSQIGKFKTNVSQKDKWDLLNKELKKENDYRQSFNLSPIQLSFPIGEEEQGKYVPKEEYNRKVKNTIKAKQEKRILPDDPIFLQINQNGIYSAVMKFTHPDTSSIQNFVFCVGSTPGEADLRWWQNLSKESVNNTYYTNPVNIWTLNVNEGTTVYITIVADDGTVYSNQVTHEVTFDFQELGNPSYDLTVDYENWTPTQETNLKWFIDRMLPIIKDIYGPPSHPYNVTLLYDPLKDGYNIFYPQRDEIQSGTPEAYRLITHELIHAMRDENMMAANTNWQFSQETVTVEEAFSEGLALICMNKFIELYPNNYLNITGLYQSIHGWDYDYQNTAEVTTQDIWSSTGGMWMYYVRYSLGAAAMFKMYVEDENVAKNINTSLYNSLNSNHSQTISRDFIKSIFANALDSVEHKPMNVWFDEQREFDCEIVPGNKIWCRTQFYPGSDKYIILNAFYYYETFSNGSDWAYYDPQDPNNINGWVYYHFNGTNGHSKLKNYSGDIVDSRNIQIINPSVNPPDPNGYAYGKTILNLTTDDDPNSWPENEPKITALHDFGAYKFEVEYGSGDEYVFNYVIRPMGDALIGAGSDGLVGILLNDRNGTISTYHKEGNFIDENIPVQNGAFYDANSWTAIVNGHPQTTGKTSLPGHVTFLYKDDNNDMFFDYKNIDWSNWGGRQMVMLNSQNMIPFTSNITKSHIICDDETIELQAPFFPDANYEWKNGTTLVSTQRNFVVSNTEGSGTYNLSIIHPLGTVTDYTEITFEDCSTLDLEVISEDVSCFDANDGSIVINVISGTVNTYTWTPNVSSNNSATNLPPGTYVIDITGSENRTLTITISEPDEIQISSTVFPASPGIANGQIDISVIGGISPYTYLWNTGDTSEDLIGVLIGTYNVTVTDATGCSSNVSIDVTSNVGLENILNNKILIYPNPTNGKVNLLLKDIVVNRLIISDILGKQIFEKVKIQQNEEIDFSAYRRGIYFITIETNDEIFSTKIIKD